MLTVNPILTFATEPEEDLAAEAANNTWTFDETTLPPGSFTDPVNVDQSALVPIGTQNQTGVQGQSSTNPTLSVAGLSEWFMGILKYAVQLILALSLVSFLYGIFRLVFLDASNEAERTKARKFMLWGIVALFVMVSVWGLVKVLQSSFFGSGGGLIIPTFK
ncbi:MAG: hypothetical protein RJB39_417 [Candidatus Parcubacteria bacterium]